MADRPIVTITDFIEKDADLAPERGVLGDLAEIRALEAEGEPALRGQVEDATCLMVYHFVAVRKETIARLKNCRLIVRCGVGYDNVDVEDARAAGINVCNVPDYGTEDVADSAIALMMSLARGTHLLNSRLRRGQGPWIYLQAVPLYRLRGRWFGVVGFGRIGTAAARRAQALGMNVAFYDPYIADGWDKANGCLRVETLDELLAKCHVVSVHCPSSDETAGMIDAAAIARMQPGSFLINTARGQIVDTAAIPPAIRSGQLAGAGIDVLPVEPPAEDDPLITAWRDPNDPCHDRLVLVPHAAFYCEEGLTDMRTKSAEACRRLLKGLPLRNVVN